MARTSEDGQKLPRWLYDWDDLTNHGWGDVLIGNGSSRSVSERFDYKSLLSVATTKIEPPLDDSDRAFFEGLVTTDFERVLSALNTGLLVNGVLSLPTSPIEDRYDGIRMALCRAVNYVHPGYSDVGLDKLDRANSVLSQFKRVFTTNYDLLVYWAVMRDSTQFVDFFWGSGNGFNPLDVEIFGANVNRTQVYYLHGALMIFLGSNGLEAKLAAGASGLLARINSRISDGDSPIFVSEGEPRQKLLAIRRHSYLEFALGSFEASEDKPRPLRVWSLLK